MAQACGNDGAVRPIDHVVDVTTAQVIRPNDVLEPADVAKPADQPKK